MEKENEFVIRYFWNFTSITKNDKKEEKETISNKDDKKEKEEIISNEDDRKDRKDKYIYDYKNYKKMKIEYDDITKYKIKEYNKYYYIIPGSEINRSLDSVILKPYNKNTFEMICIQATKFKYVIKEKMEYINDCFITKSKFESIYGININNVYFYFLLSDEFPNKAITKNLESKGIEYFYYSIKDEKFKKEDDTIFITNLNKEKAKIEQKISENENLLFKSKLGLFNIMTHFLQRKRRKEKNFKITQNYFDKARKYLFNKTPKIRIDLSNKKEMEKIVKNNSKFSSKLFMFVFLFMIKPYEYNELKEIDELIGILVSKNKKNKKIYHYIYKGEIFPNNYENISLNEFFSNKKRDNRILELKNEEYLVSDVPEEYVNKFILIFKIYPLKEIERKK